MTFRLEDLFMDLKLNEILQKTERNSNFGRASLEIRFCRYVEIRGYGPRHDAMCHATQDIISILLDEIFIYLPTSILVRFCVFSMFYCSYKAFILHNYATKQNR